jgi:hypothetical protein
MPDLERARNRHAPAVALATALGVLVAACSSDGGVAGTSTAPAPAPGPSEVIQRGSVVVAQSNLPLDGATVTIGGRQAKTAADGSYSLVAPRGTPYAMRIEAPEHYTLLEQEWIAPGDITRDREVMLPNNLADLLAALLPNRDATKGVLVVRVNAVRGCGDAEGATLSLVPAGAQVRYFAGGLPSASATSVSKAEVLSAVFYDVPVDTPLVVTAASGACAPIAFPLDEDGVTYTGKVSAKAGAFLSYVRVFLGAPAGVAVTDAGAR